MTGFNRYATMEAREGVASVAYDSEAKKAWDKKNMVFVGFKLFREVNGKRNDQDIIDYLDGKAKGEVIKTALREYIERIDANQQIDFAAVERGVSIAICATIAGHRFYSATEYETGTEAQDNISALREYMAKHDV